MNLAVWVFTGGVAGVISGVLFGEYCSVLKPVGSAYVMLLQSVVYPYIICSLLHGLGRLSPAMALHLLKRSWHLLLLLWAGIFGAIYLLSLCIPPLPDPTAINAMAQAHATPNLLEIILPANFFSDITNNYVPAVVVFAILYGVAIQKHKNKESLLHILELFKTASITIWNWVVRLAPFAVFAMFAHTTGTLHPQQLAALGFYVGAFLAGTVFLAFVALPWFISALAPISHREVISDLQKAYVLAAVTTLSVAALPFVMEAAQKLLKNADVEEKESSEIIETNLALSYPLGQLGNFFVYLFMLFSAHFHAFHISLSKSITLPILTLLSCIGAPSSTVNAVGFLSAWIGLPPENMDLYVETMVVTRYGQVLLSVSGFAFLTFLCTLSYFGKLTVKPKKLFVGVLVFFTVITGFSLALRHFHESINQFEKAPHMYMVLPEELTTGVQVRVHKPPEDLDHGRGRPRPNESTIQRIRRTGKLYVGYNPQIVPFAYFNKHGDLVGYDVAFAYELARTLNVELVFVPFTWTNLITDLQNQRFDIAMSGTYMTGPRSRKLGFSRPYHHDHFSLIVDTDDAQGFTNMDDIHDMDGLIIACFDDPVLLPLAKKIFKNAEIVPVKDYAGLVQSDKVDGCFWTYTESARFAATNPGHTAVLPKDMGAMMVYTYFTPPDSPMLLHVLDHWLDRKQSEGFSQKQRDLWLEGKSLAPAGRRWCVMQDVFGWGL